MDKDTRSAIERATQRARRLLEEDFAEQLEGDLRHPARPGIVAAKPGGAPRSDGERRSGSASSPPSSTSAPPA